MHTAEPDGASYQLHHAVVSPDPSWPVEEKTRTTVPGAIVTAFADPSDGSADIETADAVYGTVPPELFVPAKKLRWICVVCWSGYEALVNSNIVVTGIRAVATSIFLHTRWRSRPPLPGDSSTTYRGSVRRRRDTPRSSLSVCGLLCSLTAVRFTKPTSAGSV